jgi:hypothetical protein
VYLYTPCGDGASKSPTLTVSIADLNPGLLRSDEDWIGGHGLHYGGTVSTSFPSSATSAGLQSLSRWVNGVTGGRKSSINLNGFCTR